MYRKEYSEGKVDGGHGHQHQEWSVEIERWNGDGNYPDRGFVAVVSKKEIPSIVRSGSKR